MASSPGEVVSDRWLTVPNALSLLRIACLPVFAWLVLGPGRNGLAVIVLMIAGVSDYLDGYVARRWKQVTRIGRILDPLADRLTSIIVPITLALSQIVPWWLVIALLARDLVLVVATAVLLGRRRVTLQVHYLGKAATFCLLAGFPLIVLGTFEGNWGDIARVAGWALVLWGTLLYWWSAQVYLLQIRSLSTVGE